MAITNAPDGTPWSDTFGPIVVAHCCRDWPVAAWAPIGRCGDCGTRPAVIDKPISQYMAERPPSPV